MTYETQEDTLASAHLRKLASREQLRQSVKNKNFIVWDGGSNQITMMHGSGSVVSDGFEVSKQDFIALNIPGLKPGTALIGEEAHHRARNALSLSHVFTIEELQELQANAVNRGVVLYMFNQDTTQFARHGVKDKSSEYKGTDRFDCYAIKEYILKMSDRQVDGLRLFEPKTTEDHQLSVNHILLLRNEVNKDNLIAQALGFDDPDNAILQFIDEHLPAIAELLTEEERAAFEIKKLKGGPRKGQTDANVTRLYPVLSTLIKRDGGLRRRLDNGQVPYWHFVSNHLFGIQASHRKAGCVAAKYKYYIRLALSDFKMTFDDGETSWKERRLEALMKKAEEGKAGRQDPVSGRVTMHTNLAEEVRPEFKRARAEADKRFRAIWRKLRQYVLNNLTD